MKDKRLSMTFYKPLLWKAYFDKGFSLLSYIKYPITLIGFGAVLGGVSWKMIILIAFLYAVFCTFLGRVWFHYHLIDTENEINNLFNPFQVEVREAIKKRKI